MFLLGLSVLLVSLESASRRLPGAGSTSISFLASLALLSAGGPAAACLVTSLAWLVRNLLVRPHPVAKTAIYSAFTEIAPRLCGLGASFLAESLTMKLLLASSVYILLGLLTPSWLASQLPGELARAYLTVQSRLTGLRVAVCCVGGLLSWFVLQSRPEPALLLLPVVWQMQRTLELNTKLEEQVQRSDVVRQLERNRQALDATRQEKLNLSQDLNRQQREYQILEVTAGAMLQVQDLAATAAKIVKLCLGLAAVQSVVVFLRQGEELVPVQPYTPHQERLRDRALLALEEPMLSEALRSGQPQLRPLGEAERRVFRDEPHALAFPLGQLGVLYLGRPQNFTASEINYLSQAAWTAGLGLLAAVQLQELKENLQQRQRLAAELSAWSGAIEAVLQCSTRFLQHLNPGQLEHTLQETVADLFPCDRIQVSLAGAADHPAGRQAISQQTPLLIDDLQQTRWHSPQDWQVSMLLVPIVHPDMGEVGLISLESKARGAFQRQHLALLSILASLAAVAGKNAELHTQTLTAQAQLIQSSKLAAVGQLAAGIAHELNTPLASIALNCDMLGKLLAKPDLDPAAAQTRLGRILDSMTRAQSIANKLLYYCREGSSGQRPVCPRQLVEDTLEFLGQVLAQDGLQVECELAQTAHILVNPNEVQQVLINLLLNARDAVKNLPEERRAVTIRVVQADDEICLQVHDRGQGIALENQPRILEPFFTTKPVGEGTGLGLSISQQILNAHGGRLEFSSQPGQGSCFEMWLPAA
ncbi:MAG: ATP-binding protein [Vulcanimicrobiota bacterium]